jgi:AAT family amino acid transporter
MKVVDPGILVQGWSSILPVFSPVAFTSFYIELPVMLVMYAAWLLSHRSRQNLGRATIRRTSTDALLSSPPTTASRRIYSDLVDVMTVDLRADEYKENERDKKVDDERERKILGKAGLLWKAYYWLA